MGAQDLNQNYFEVGDVVFVPIVVTAIGGSAAEPTVTGTTKYPGFNGATDTVGPVDSIQVVPSD